MPVLSPELSRHLDSGGSHELAREMSRVPALLTECMDALPALEFAARGKAEEAGVKAVISRRFPLYPQPQRSESEWAAWWADYIDALADTPLASLEAAMRAYVADPESEFMPKPGKLRELAFTTPCRSLGRYLTAKSAVSMALTPPAPIEPYREPAPPVDPAEVKQWLADYRAGRAASKDQSHLPSIAGKTDERGVTPQMRELMSRRAG